MREPFAAGIAKVGFLSGMGPHVGFQDAGCRESLLTDIAAIGPFTGVRSHMGVEVAFMLELFAAHIAEKSLI